MSFSQGDTRYLSFCVVRVNLAQLWSPLNLEVLGICNFLHILHRLKNLRQLIQLTSFNNQRKRFSALTGKNLGLYTTQYTCTNNNK
jgi:hypothetical protein